MLLDGSDKPRTRLYGLMTGCACAFAERGTGTGICREGDEACGAAAPQRLWNGGTAVVCVVLLGACKRAEGMGRKSCRERWQTHSEGVPFRVSEPSY